MTPALVHAAATWAMVGFIWTIQLLAYPQMARVPHAGFVEFERSHQTRVTAVIALFGPAEVVTAGWLLLDPGEIPRLLTLAAGLILAAIWTSTGLFSAPLHARLAGGFDATLHRRLVRANWLRTIAWTVRGLLALVMLS